jgi:outer membrane lipoprotein carrier protein
MKYLIPMLMIATTLFSSMRDIKSFEADFKQTITDDKNKSISYIGHVSAIKPQTALWKPDIEPVIIKVKS